MVIGRYKITDIFKKVMLIYLVLLMAGYMLIFNVLEARALSLDAAYENATGYEAVGWCGGGAGDYRTYCRRNCTSSVAYNLAMAGVSVAHYRNNGNGKDWDDNAAAKGIPKGSTPKVGAVAYWNSGGGGYGHVGWVDSINFDGSVNTSNYNGLTGEFYKQSSARPEGYIYFSNTTDPVFGGVGSAVFLGGDTLSPGMSIYPNQYITSADVRSVLILQKDGNLVLYQGGYKARWHTNTSGQQISRAVMQSDGNLVMYRTDGSVAWHSRTNGNTGSRLSLQSDGNLVIYSPSNKPIWNTGSILGAPAYYISSDRLLPGKVLYSNQFIRSADRRYVFSMQSDGNLVLYAPGGKALWNSGTLGKGGDRAIVQPDGNLVIYNSSGVAVWNSGKFAKVMYLVLQPDGNVVMYNDASKAYWSTATSGRI